MVGFVAGLLSAAFVISGILLVAAGVVHVVLVALVGLVVGALSLRAVPAPDADPTATGTALAVGVGGSFLGGLAGWFVFGSGVPRLLASVAGAAFLVCLVRRPDRTRLH